MFRLGCFVALALPLVACEGTTTTSNTPSKTTEDSGTAGATGTAVRGQEVFVQTLDPLVDVLFVADATDIPGHTEAIEHLPHFFAFHLESGADNHFGVVSADLATGGAEIEWSDRKPIKWTALGIADMLEGTTFTPLDAAYQAIEIVDNPGFLRSDASLHVVVLGSTPPDAEDLGTKEFEGWLAGLRSGPATTLSVIGSPPPADLTSLAEGSGGLVADLQGTDADAVFTELGLLTSGLRRTFHLSQRPQKGTLEVEVKSPAPVVTLALTEGDDFTYDAEANAVELLALVPEVGHTVTVSYELAP